MARARDAGVPPLNEFRRQMFADDQRPRSSRRTRAGRTSASTSSTRSRWSTSSPRTARTRPSADDRPARPRSSRPAATDGAAGARRPTPRPDDVDAGPAGRPADCDRPLPASGDPPRCGRGLDERRDGVTTTGLDDVDLWVGGLAEVTNLFGGLLGSTFNYVFQNQLETCRTATGSTTSAARRA